MPYTESPAEERGLFIVKNDKIKAVFVDDLESLLTSLGIYEDIVDGNVCCLYCGTRITTTNIEAIVPIDKKARIVCTMPECRTRLLSNKGKTE